MIYVHRDLSKIPVEKLAALKALSDQLNGIADRPERKAFIAANQAAWSQVRGELVQMSHYKCWYTEAKDAVSRYQTDHFRPHGKAKQAKKTIFDGYCWLAFDIYNYRIVGVLANSENKEYSDETIGKGIWFPLLDPAKKATLLNQSTALEIPLLLDPTDTDDPDKIEFLPNGEARPNINLSDEEQKWVEDAIVYMGIRQSVLNSKRRAKWRICLRLIHQYNRFYKKPKADRTVEEMETMKEISQELVSMSSCKSEFSAAVRCCLSSEGLGRLVIRDELGPLVLET
jgi:hypothetical protein